MDTTRRFTTSFECIAIGVGAEKFVFLEFEGRVRGIQLLIISDFGTLNVR